jgi:peptide/nickel transport system ATP-binding protein
MNELLKAENILYSVKEKIPKTAGSGKQDKVILKDISFSVMRGAITGIAGESGSGKTTLAKILTGIIKPVSGVINYNFADRGSDRKNRINPVQILFQNSVEILNPLRIIEDVIKEAVAMVENKNEVNARVDDLLKEVDFPEHLRRRKGYELSGGEMQRAALARILAVKPELIILDEPFSAQDIFSRRNFLNLFKKIKNDFGLTMICISHNLKILKELADEVMIMYRGEIVEKGSAERIFNSPENAYTKFLLSAESYELQEGFKYISSFEG